MSEPEKIVACYTLTHDGAREYPQVRIHVFASREERVADKIAGCVGNAAQYGGGQETADRLMGEFVRLRDAGHGHVLGSGPYSAAAYTLRYQEYDGDRGGASYCSAHVESAGGDADRLSGIERTVGALKKLARRVQRIRGRDAGEPIFDGLLDNPTEVIAALEAGGARRVEYVKLAAYSSHAVYATGPRPVLRTDPPNVGDPVSVAGWGDHYKGPATYQGPAPGATDPRGEKSVVTDDVGNIHEVWTLSLGNLVTTWPTREHEYRYRGGFGSVGVAS